MHSYLSGVGGWLAFLIFTLFAGPVIGFGNLYGQMTDAVAQNPQLHSYTEWAQYKLATWTVFAASAGLSVSAGYRLWKVHTAESVRFAILALWLIGPVARVLYTSVGIWAFGVGVTPEDVGTVAAAGIVASLWTAYLLRSGRVRNTYGTSAAPALPANR
ncbi:MAG TPA: DUF2569 family protein [Noviherbaspirillum sp.]|nr:DUF2569 family protein [Noviherbaspirillum sp.]